MRILPSISPSLFMLIYAHDGVGVRKVKNFTVRLQNSPSAWLWVFGLVYLPKAVPEADIQLGAGGLEGPMI
jgi:hypothetical protein